MPVERFSDEGRREEEDDEIDEGKGERDGMTGGGLEWKREGGEGRRREEKGGGREEEGRRRMRCR